MNRHERRKTGKKTRTKKTDEPRSFQLHEMDEAHLIKLREAVNVQQNGDVERAEKIYRQLLKKYPNNPDCLNLLGVAQRSKGNPQEAAELIQQAIDHSPQPAFFKNLANTLKDLNKYADAREAFAQYLAHEEADASENNFMGSLLHHMGEHDEALVCINKALVQDPAHAPALNNLAAVYLDMGRVADAQAPLQQALALDPENSNFITNYGLYHAATGQDDKARELYERALKIDPNNVGAEQNLADIASEDQLVEALETLLTVLPKSPNRLKTLKSIANTTLKLGRAEEALDYLQQAMELAPEDPAILTLFAGALADMDRPEEAIPFIEAAIRADPVYCDAYIRYALINHALLDFEFAVACLAQAMVLRPGDQMVVSSLGTILLAMGHTERATEAFESVLEINPNSAHAHYNYSYLLLNLGKLKQGWEAYHWRYRCQGFWAFSPPRHFTQPEWNGEPLKGKKILAYSEQGMGDQIMFATELPDLVAKGGKVTLEIEPRLVPLYQRTFPELEVLPNFLTPEEVTQAGFDYQIATPDLSRFFRSDVKDFPATPPTLKVDAEEAEIWKKRLAEISDRPKVGISWRGGMLTRQRSPQYASPEDLAEIMAIEGVDFINTQYSYTQEELNEFKELYGVELHTWDDLDLKQDLDRLVALLSELDVVVGPSTVTTVLSAAVGQKTLIFCLQHKNWDLLGLDHWPWFKDAKPFTKPTPTSDWEDTFPQLAAEMRDHLNL